MSLKDNVVFWSEKLGLPRIFGGAPHQGLTSILFHGFIFEGDTIESARDRLKYMLDFIVSNYDPVSLDESLLSDTERTKDAPQILITIDDAKRDILEIIDLFNEFEIPIVQFVCAGWSNRRSKSSDFEDIKAKLISCLHFYKGKPELLVINNQNYEVRADGNAKIIDSIIDTPLTQLEQLHDSLADIMKSLTTPDVCTWNELIDLQSAGMTIGCHSISHTRIARESQKRRQYEIHTSKLIVESKLGPSPWFAYPYGTADSYDSSTREILKSEGFSAAFTTRPALINNNSDLFELPRIAMPEKSMAQRHFEARVRGGNVPLNRLKEWIS